MEYQVSQAIEDKNFNLDSFLKEKKILTTNSSGIIIDDLNAQDIDNENDWKIAYLAKGRGIKHRTFFSTSTFEMGGTRCSATRRVAERLAHINSRTLQ